MLAPENILNYASMSIKWLNKILWFVSGRYFCAGSSDAQREGGKQKADIQLILRNTSFKSKQGA